MSTQFFSLSAREYWDAGYSPLPLIGKRPLVKNWSSYCDNLPKSETQADWLVQHPNANIGLALGKEIIEGYRLGALDVDDQDFVRLVDCIIGKPTPAKIGKKGKTSFVLVEKKSGKSTVLQDADGKGAIDVLVSGKQTVIPPSVHPDTHKPYEWEGPPLLEWDKEELPQISSEDLALLKVLVASPEAKQLLSGSHTHDAGVKLAAILVRYVENDKKIEEIFRSLLPASYQGNSLDELPSWLVSAREKGFDQIGTLPIDESVAQLVEKEFAPLVFTIRDGFLQYVNGFWRPVPNNDIRRLAKAHLLTKVGPKSQVSGMIPGAEKCLALNVENPDFGKSEGKICLTNGTLDIKLGTLLPHSANHQLRYGLDMEWDPNAECPTYLEQLQTTLRGDQKAIDTFEEFAGLTLLPDLKFHKAMYLIGEGGSGKSTLLKTLELMHDPNAISVTPLDKIDDERYRADLVSKLVCITYDVQTDQKVFREAFVRITGGDPVAVRRLFKEVEGLVHPTVRFIGSMNPDMPAFVGAPDALRRRLLFLSCGARVDSPDPFRQDKIGAERPGILVRWVKALKRLYARGKFDPPSSSVQEVEDYLSAYEPIDGFVSERLEQNSDNVIPISEIAQQFNMWADETGERHLTANVLGRKMRRLGFEVGQRKIARPKGKVNTRVVFAIWTASSQNSSKGIAF